MIPHTGPHQLKKVRNLSELHCYLSPLLKSLFYIRIPRSDDTDHVLLFMQMETEIIVDLACGMAVLRGAHVFAQGIMAAHPGIIFIYLLLLIYRYRNYNAMF